MIQQGIRATYGLPEIRKYKFPGKFLLKSEMWTQKEVYTRRMGPVACIATIFPTLAIVTPMASSVHPRDSGNGQPAELVEAYLTRDV